MHDSTAETPRKTQHTEADTESNAESVPEFMSSAPKEVQRLFAAVASYGPSPNPLMKKVNEQHIDKILENKAQETRLEFQKHKHNSYFAIILVSILLAFLVFCIVFLQNNPELLKMLISGILGLVAGAIGGYGIGRSRKDP